jgi:hypothetical protein
MTAETSPRLSPSGRRLPQTPASFVPLSSVIWVDGATVVPLAEQNGFIGTPFATAAQAVAVAILGDVIILAPTDGSSYGTIELSTSLCVQSVSSALEHFDGVQSPPCHTPLAAVVLTNCTVALVNLQIESLDLTEDATCSLSGCELNGVSARSGGDIQVNDSQFNGGDFAGVTIVDSYFAGPMTASQMNAENSVFGDIGNGATDNVLSLVSCSAGAITCGALTLESSTVISVSSSDDIVVRNSTTSGTLHTDFNLSSIGMTIGGAVTVGGNATIFASQLSGGLTVTGNLTIDGSSYTYALQHGSVAVTGSLNVTSAPYGKVQKQLAWNPASAANSNVLTLLPAGHAPGIYVVNSALIIQAVATAATAFSRLISFNAPNGGGAQTFSQSIFGAATLWTLATPPAFFKGNTAAYSAQSTAFTLLGSNIVSDGSQPITLQFVSSGFTGTPSVDVYGSVDLVGYL